MHESATLNTGHQPDGDEVDDVAAQEPRRPREPVDEIAERTAEHENQADEHPAVGGVAHRPRHEERDDDREHRQDRRVTLETG